MLRSGDKNPETAAVKPVRPPAATPEEDSTNVVTVEVPRTAPAVVATASAINADLIPGSLPSSSSIPAFVLTPTKVPSVSNRSTNKKDNTTAIKLKIPTLSKSYWKHLPKVSPNFEKSVIANVGEQAVITCFEIRNIDSCYLAEHSDHPCSKDSDQDRSRYFFNIKNDCDQ